MYRAGIDLGGTNIKAGIVDEDQKILVEDSVPTRVERPYQEIIKDMADLVKNLLNKIHATDAELYGVGVGSPGTVDAANGVVLYSNNFDWDNVPLAAELGKYFTCPIKVSNDANCAALGEVKAGAAREIKNAILITLGTGVGGGVIIDGQVFEGAHAGGAELGHTSLIFGGELCTCGRRGCVEAYVSATGLIREAKRAAEKDPQSVMNDLGESIANYVNIFRPDVILLSGGVCNQKEKLTEPLTEYIKTKCFGGEKAFIPEVRCAILGNSAGIIGAANL